MVEPLQCARRFAPRSWWARSAPTGLSAHPRARSATASLSLPFGLRLPRPCAALRRARCARRRVGWASVHPPPPHHPASRRTNPAQPNKPIRTINSTRAPRAPRGPRDRSIVLASRNLARRWSSRTETLFNAHYPGDRYVGPIFPSRKSSARRRPQALHLAHAPGGETSRLAELFSARVSGSPGAGRGQPGAGHRKIAQC